MYQFLSPSETLQQSKCSIWANLVAAAYLQLAMRIKEPYIEKLAFACFDYKRAKQLPCNFNLQCDHFDRVSDENSTLCASIFPYSNSMVVVTCFVPD